MRPRQNLWHKSPLKNDKVHFSVFFHWQIFLYIKAKLMVSKSLYSTRRYFFIWHIWKLQIKKRNFFFQLCPSAKLVTSFCFVIFQLNNWYMEKRMKSITKKHYVCILAYFLSSNHLMAKSKKKRSYTQWSIFRILVWWQFFRLYCSYMTFKHTRSS